MIDTVNQDEYLTRRFTHLVAICGLSIGAIWVAELVARPFPPAAWSIAGYVISLITMCTIAVGARAIRLRALRLLMWFATAIGLLLQLLSFAAGRGPVPPVVWEVSWTFTGVYLCFLALLFSTSRPHLVINHIAMVTAVVPAISYWMT